MNQIWLNAVRASGGAVPWWRAGGAPEPVAAYQPIGAASLAASYLRVAGTGGNANLDPAVVGSGVAPTWASGTGWVFDGIDQFLNTGIVPSSGYAMLIRFSGVGADKNAMLAGSFLDTPAARFYLSPAQPVNEVAFGSGGFSSIAPRLLTGTMAVAGQSGYRNGIDTGITIPAWAGVTTREIYIGALNTGIASNFRDSNIQLIVIYPTSLDHATWIPAVSAAAAAL